MVHSLELLFQNVWVDKGLERIVVLSDQVTIQACIVLNFFSKLQKSSLALFH